MPMDPTELVSKIPTTVEGWVSWGVCAVFGGTMYVSKYLAEKRGDNKEITRLENVLAEERTRRTAAENKNQELNDRINDLVQKFSDQNATNARLEEQMKHLAEQNDELRKQVAHLQNTIQGARQS